LEKKVDNLETKVDNLETKMDEIIKMLQKEKGLVVSGPEKKISEGPRNQLLCVNLGGQGNGELSMDIWSYGKLLKNILLWMSLLAVVGVCSALAITVTVKITLLAMDYTFGPISDSIFAIYKCPVEMVAALAGQIHVWMTGNKADN